MTAKAVHTDAMKIENANKACFNSVSKKSFSSLGKSLSLLWYFFLQHILLNNSFVC